jgi:hypothetical protein
MALERRNKGRWLERSFLIAVAIVLGLLFNQLYTVLKRDFEEVPRRLSDGSMVNLNGNRIDERIAALLQKGYYFEDPRDIAMIRTVIASKLSANESIDNIGELNKAKYNVAAEEAFAKGGDSYKRRVELSRALLGFSGDDSLRYEQEKRAPEQLPAVTDVGMGKYKIGGKISNGSEAGVPGVLVRLELILPRDSAYSETVSEVDRIILERGKGIRRTYVLDTANHRQLQSLTAYARTDDEGKFSFVGLPEDKAFSVLPLQPGYQFGPSKGTEKLDENITFNFYQSLHTIRLLSTKDYNNLRKEKALIVRTPEDFTKWFWIIVGVFFGGFFLVHIFLSVKLQDTDQLILPVVMTLTGLSLITLLSLQDPLRDRFLAKSTIGYFVAGITGLCFLLLFNLRKFTADSGLYRMFFLKNKTERGWQWAVAAVGLLILTIFLGSGPEGSGVKVNLFGFQPSEIVKFLIIIFLAGFFSTNERFIAEYRSWQNAGRSFHLHWLPSLQLSFCF